MTKISVISPVYNGQKYIKNFIKSLKNQTFMDFELLLINDGSTDNTYEIANQELKKSQLKYKIINKKNGGQSSARNLGIEKAKGEYIVLLDSDDTIQKKYLENMYQMALKFDCSVVICDLNRVDDSNIFEESNDDLKYDLKTGKEFMVDFIKHYIEIGPCSLMISNEFIKEISLRFNEKSRYSEEHIFICHLLHEAKNVVHLKQKLYNYCLRSGSVSTGASVDKILNGYNEIINSNIKYKKCNCKYCKEYNKFAMPRWILATARFSSKNMSYKYYKELMLKLEYKSNLKKLYDFPSFIIRISSKLLNFNLFIAYIFFRLWGGNK
ncbi:MAG: glycosyltransferase family 2 protein [Bacilli bacterium]|nr:glycosyltransferase family 2 protein [Bacilli bacterium]